MSRLLLLAICILPATLQAGEAWKAARAVLSERCTKCHGGVKHKGGLDLRAVPTILRGGESGPAVVVGDPSASLLMEVIGPDTDTEMPPKGERLSKEEVATIATWISSLAEPEAPAEFALPQEISPRLIIDFLVARGWEDREVIPSDATSDAAYVRRAYLDLIGRIPTMAERRTFLADTSYQKRTHLVDDLLERAEFARHFAEIFDTVLMGRRHGLVGNTRALQRDGDWHAYLKWVFSSNRPWNEVAHDLIKARPSSDQSKGARWFLVGHKDKHEDMVRTIAPALLGKQIACAQCHNHPIIPEIEQRHYWGLVAFFKRSFNVETPQGLALGEAATGGKFEFSSLEGDSFKAELAFLSGKTVSESPDEEGKYLVSPSQEYFDRLNKKEKKDDKKKKRGVLKMEAAPVPAESRRDALAEVAIDSYPEFAKAFVNRMWALLLGRGLVHPVDHLDSMHPPSHPELVDWLGEDFARNGYDIKRLIREIMASRAYQLGSVPASEQRPPDEAFACAITKPLSAEALFRSMLIAGGHAPSFEGIDQEKYRHAFAKVYGDLFPETFSPAASEGLFFTNNPLMQEILVRDFSGQTPEQIIETAFHAALGREPDAEERAQSLAYLEDHPERASSFLWALIAGSEFRFNH